MRRVNRRGPSTRTPASPKRSSAVYSAEQRDQLQRGLRILARMVVHAHLRRGGIPRCVGTTGAAIGQRD